MAECRVLHMGNPLLHRSAEPVAQFDTPDLHGLVADLWDTMWARGGVGLAAPQIGIALQVIVFEVQAHPRFPDVEPVPKTVLINPHTEPLGDELEADWEGCLSLPGLRGLVPRHRRIGYRAWDPHGALVEREVEGYHARIVQHECDHLQGRLYPQRIEDFSQFGFAEELSLAGRFSPRTC